MKKRNATHDFNFNSGRGALVVKSCILELAGYLANAAGLVPLGLDLRITHDRFGSSSDPSINGHLHYPHDFDRSLNETDTDKIRQYRTDHNNHTTHK